MSSPLRTEGANPEQLIDAVNGTGSEQHLNGCATCQQGRSRCGRVAAKIAYRLHASHTASDLVLSAIGQAALRYSLIKPWTACLRVPPATARPEPATPGHRDLDVLDRPSACPCPARAVVSSAILPAPTSRTTSGIGHERQRMAASARATDQRNTELRTHRNGGSGRPPRSMRSTGDQRILGRHCPLRQVRGCAALVWDGSERRAAQPLCPPVLTTARGTGGHVLVSVSRRRGVLRRPAHAGGAARTRWAR